MAQLNIQELSSKQLLILCATAIETNNRALVQQTVRALRPKSSVTGDPGERVTAYFLKALVQRAGSLLDPNVLLTGHRFSLPEERVLSLDELTNLVGMTPCYCFGFTAANGALLEAFDGRKEVHIVDFSTTHCMQWPTLIQALADRTGVGLPPHVRLTVCNPAHDEAQQQLNISPRVKATYEYLGSRLTHFAASRGISFTFHVLTKPLEDLEAADFGLRREECLAVNCSLRLHYLAEESAARLQDVQSLPRRESVDKFTRASGAASNPYSSRREITEELSIICARDKFLQLIHSLHPAVVTLYEEDCDTTSTNLVCRLTNLYEHEWLPFDFLATFLQDSGGRINEQLLVNRLEYERNVGRRIHNTICAFDGVDHFLRGSSGVASRDCCIERLESKEQWVQRMQRLQFTAVPITQDVVTELRDLITHHASGWGLRINEGDHTQLLSWKGHGLTFASAWVPTYP